MGREREERDGNIVVRQRRIRQQAATLCRSASHSVKIFKSIAPQTPLQWRLNAVSGARARLTYAQEIWKRGLASERHNQGWLKPWRYGNGV